MSILLSIISISSPLLIVTCGALASEWAGRMALFLDGLISFAAFLCYAFTSFTGNPITGCLLTILTCVLIIVIFEQSASKLNADFFLTSLALNLLFPSFATLLGFYFFGTRGVLYSQSFNYKLSTVNFFTTAVSYIFTAGFALFAIKTKSGLALRISGSSAQVLDAQGLSSSFYKTLSWIIAASCAAITGCILTLRLNSYVPGVAGGRGWIALAIVFLGHKNIFITGLCVIIFAIAEYASSSLQNIQMFKDISSAFLLALPYIASLSLILITPRSKK